MATGQMWLPAVDKLENELRIQCKGKRIDSIKTLFENYIPDLKEAVKKWDEKRIKSAVASIKGTINRHHIKVPDDQMQLIRYLGHVKDGQMSPDHMSVTGSGVTARPLDNLSVDSVKNIHQDKHFTDQPENTSSRLEVSVEPVKNLEETVADQPNSGTMKSTTQSHPTDITQQKHEAKKVKETKDGKIKKLQMDLNEAEETNRKLNKYSGDLAQALEEKTNDMEKMAKHYFDRDEKSKEENRKQKHKISVLENEIRSLEAEQTKLKAENNDLATRYSQIASASLKDNSRNRVDLSDNYRAKKLAERTQVALKLSDEESSPSQLRQFTCSATGPSMESNFTNSLRGGNDEFIEWRCTKCYATGRTNDASLFCLECDEYYCDSCVKPHTRTHGLNVHKLMNEAQKAEFDQKHYQNEQTNECQTLQDKINVLTETARQTSAQIQELQDERDMYAKQYEELKEEYVRVILERNKTEKPKKT